MGVRIGLHGKNRAPYPIACVVAAFGAFHFIVAAFGAL